MSHAYLASDAYLTASKWIQWRHPAYTARLGIQQVLRQILDPETRVTVVGIEIYPSTALLRHGDEAY